MLIHIDGDSIRFRLLKVKGIRQYNGQTFAKVGFIPKVGDMVGLGEVVTMVQPLGKGYYSIVLNHNRLMFITEV